MELNLDLLKVEEMVLKSGTEKVEKMALLLVEEKELKLELKLATKYLLL